MVSHKRINDHRPLMQKEPSRASCLSAQIQRAAGWMLSDGIWDWRKVRLFRFFPSVCPEEKRWTFTRPPESSRLIFRISSLDPFFRISLGFQILCRYKSVNLTLHKNRDRFKSTQNFPIEPLISKTDSNRCLSGSFFRPFFAENRII